MRRILWTQPVSRDENPSALSMTDAQASTCEPQIQFPALLSQFWRQLCSEHYETARSSVAGNMRFWGPAGRDQRVKAMVCLHIPGRKNHMSVGDRVQLSAGTCSGHDVEP